MKIKFSVEIVSKETPYDEEKKFKTIVMLTEKEFLALSENVIDFVEKLPV